MQAALDVFAGHATVQRAGSVSKGTGVRGMSDFDFFVSQETVRADIVAPSQPRVGPWTMHGQLYKTGHANHQAVQ
jgi:tRNA nucleotidyltransferase (CCA-adding enzyme)